MAQAAAAAEDHGFFVPAEHFAMPSAFACFQTRGFLLIRKAGVRHQVRTPFALQSSRYGPLAPIPIWRSPARAHCMGAKEWSFSMRR